MFSLSDYTQTCCKQLLELLLKRMKIQDANIICSTILYFHQPMKKKKVLTFICSFVWLKSVKKNSNLWSTSAVLSQLCCISKKTHPCPCRVQVERKHYIHSSRKGMLGFCMVKILSKYRNI